jgi:hypothetical protein
VQRICFHLEEGQLQTFQSQELIELEVYNYYYYHILVVHKRIADFFFQKYYHHCPVIRINRGINEKANFPK